MSSESGLGSASFSAAETENTINRPRIITMVDNRRRSRDRGSILRYGMGEGIFLRFMKAENPSGNTSLPLFYLPKHRCLLWPVQDHNSHRSGQSDILFPITPGDTILFSMKI